MTDGQTDGRTDRQTDILPRNVPRYAYASRGKKTSRSSQELHFWQNYRFYGTSVTILYWLRGHLHSYRRLDIIHAVKFRARSLQRWLTAKQGHICRFTHCVMASFRLHGSPHHKTRTQVNSTVRVARYKRWHFQVSDFTENHLYTTTQRTRGQSDLTKSASRGAHSPVRGHPRGSKVVPLNSWGRVSYWFHSNYRPRMHRLAIVHARDNQWPTTSRHSLYQ